MKDRKFIFILFSCLIFFNYQLIAQKKPNPEVKEKHKKVKPRIFKKGQADVWMGLGLLPTYLMDDGKIIVPPLTLGGDLMIADHISVGGQAGFSVSETRVSDDADAFRHYRNSSFFLNIRTAVHITRFDNWDLYGGYSLGYNFVRLSVVGGEFNEEDGHRGIEPQNDNFTFSAILGARFACCKNIGTFYEIGYGASLLKVGMTYRL